ncbi:MAG: aminoacyl-tRNA hydrolase [Chloroflexi bacterium]|nr:MAG: aminoacyl-tRNA hydrolase [Chloroflexota bacterium]
MEPYLIAGLGNPGPKYTANRHNIGFRCLERLAAAHDLAFDRRQKRARVALGTIQGRRVVLAKPQTFMNESGRAVAPLAHFYKVPLERLLVVYDDLDLPLGTIRLRPEGGSGGHKGMRSIIEHLGSQEFPRLRIGIGRPPGQMDPAAYVLQDFSTEEETLLDEVLERAVAAIETWLTEGIEAAMERYNRSWARVAFEK